MNSRDRHFIRENISKQISITPEDSQLFSFEEKLQQFHKDALVIFIALTMDSSQFDTAVHIIAQLDSLFNLK